MSVITAECVVPRTGKRPLEQAQYINRKFANHRDMQGACKGGAGEIKLALAGLRTGQMESSLQCM